MTIPTRNVPETATPSFSMSSGAGPKLLKPLSRVRVERFVWQWPDTAWIIAAVLSCCVFAPRIDSLFRFAVGLMLSAMSSASAYVAGYKMHSRVAGIAAAVLIASSRNYAAICVQHPVSGAVACAAILAVASYSVGWMIVTYCAACIAFTLGFNGALVGLVIAAIPAIQRREHASAGLVGFFGFAALWSLATRSVHLPHGLRPWSSWHEAASSAGLAAFVGWFFISFYAEATLKGARERWMLGLALVAVLVLIVFTSRSAIQLQLYDAFPIAMLVVGVALARLIPLISGEYPAPSKRYAAAVVAVAATVLLKLALEPSLSSRPAPPDSSAQARRHLPVSRAFSEGSLMSKYRCA